jgi:hypothetical protein
MKCPKCGSEALQHDRWFEGYISLCLDCGEFFNERDSIDPAELLRLIEKVLIKHEFFAEGRGEYCAGRYETLVQIKHYLSGDPEPLKKLAGME